LPWLHDLSEESVNTGGISYSQAQFNAERVLTETELTAVSSLAAQVKEYAKHVGGYSVDLDDSSKCRHRSIP
jgi:hypothetical protein